MKTISVIVASLAIALSACSSTKEAANGPTEAELHAAYEKILQHTPLEYKVRHIVVERLDQAEVALRRIQNGELFESVARDVSTDSGSAKRGGYLGWSYPEDFSPEFSEVMVALAPAGITASPIKSQLGWHIIEVIATRPGPMPPFESVRDKLVKILKERQKNGQSQ